MPIKRYYEVSKTGLILTRCPFKNCVVGGWECVNCPSYKYKNMQRKYVECTRVVGRYSKSVARHRKQKS